MSDLIPTFDEAIAAHRAERGARAFTAMEKRAGKKAKKSRTTFAGWLESATLGIDSARKTPTGIVDLRAHLARLDAGALTPTERARVDEIRQTVASVEKEHQEKAPRFIAETTAAVRKLRMLNVARVAGQWIAVILGIVLLFAPGAFLLGAILILAALIGGPVLRRQLRQRAWEVHYVASTPTWRVNGVTGAPPRGRLDGTGLWAEVDTLVLAYADPATRDSVLAERRAEKEAALAARAARGGATAAPAGSRSSRPEWFSDPRVQDGYRRLRRDSPDLWGMLGTSDEVDDERIFIQALQVRGIRFDSAPETVLATIRRIQEQMQHAVIDRDVHSAEDRERRNDYGYRILDDSV